MFFHTCFFTSSILRQPAGSGWVTFVVRRSADTIAKFGRLLRIGVNERGEMVSADSGRLEFRIVKTVEPRLEN